MSIGTGIFLGLMVLSGVLLFIKTMDRWRWSRIVKIGGLVLGAILLLGIVCVGFLYYKNTAADRPRMATGLNGVYLGEKISDVEFRLGKLTKNDDENSLMQFYSGEERLGVSVDSKTRKVVSITYLCRDSADFTGVNDLRCGDSGDLIRSKYGDSLRELCRASHDKEKNSRRVFEVIEYGVQYYLERNSIDMLTIASPKELASWTERTWVPCP